MAYVDKILLPDERVLCITTIHSIVYVPGFVVAIAGGMLGYYSATFLDGMYGHAQAEVLEKIMSMIALFVVFLGALLLFFAYLRQIATELAVTNRRVIAKYGIISRMTYEIMVDRITGANFEQSFFGRLLGFGTVIVHGAGGDISPFDRIGNPEGFHKALMRVLERNQVKR